MTDLTPNPMSRKADPAKVDLVVVGFTGEMRALKLQARSIRLYTNEATFNRIFIVVNDNAFSAFKAYFDMEVLPEYGPHTGRVELLNYRLLTGEKVTKLGWRSQQAFKLMMARHVEADQYLILDSKNHFIRPVSQSAFVASDGRLSTHMYPVIPVFEAYFKAACDYFGVQPSEKRPIVMPTTTPFMVDREHASVLLGLVEAREATSFFSFFMENRQFTEFYFYYAYLCSISGAFTQTYYEGTKPNVTFFSSMADTPKKLINSSEALNNADVYILGVHRKIFDVGLPENLTIVTDLWRRFGLVSDDKEAAYFQTVDAPKKRKKFIFF